MSESSTSTNLQLSSPVYDQLKRLTMVGLPLVGTLYFTLAQIWGLPAAEEVVGTLAAINLFLGGLAQVSSRAYNSPDMFDGAIEIVKTDSGGKGYSLALHEGPEALDGKSEVRFKIDNQL